MSMLINASTNQAVTMTSLELVEFINSQRKADEAVLRHDSFMVKVPKVLGEKDAQNFLDVYADAYGRQQRCYVFPKREACLMAMSYSYELQAVVYDRMTALEAKAVQTFSLPNFTDPAEAAVAWAAEYKAKQQAIAERDHAIATKAQIGSKREATAMANTATANRKLKAIEAELGRCIDHATILAVQNATGCEYSWRPLKAYCKTKGIDPVKVHCPRFKFVQSWPAEAWLEVHGVDIVALFGEVTA